MDLRTTPALHPGPAPTHRLGKGPTHSKAGFFPQSLPVKPCRLLTVWVCFTLLHILIFEKIIFGICVSCLFLETLRPAPPPVVFHRYARCVFTWTSTGNDTCLLDIPGVSRQVFSMFLSAAGVCAWDPSIPHHHKVSTSQGMVQGVPILGTMDFYGDSVHGY